jgi:hypothetical protein
MLSELADTTKSFPIAEGIGFEIYSIENLWHWESCGPVYADDYCSEDGFSCVIDCVVDAITWLDALLGMEEDGQKETVETSICEHKVVVVSAEQLYNSLVGVVRVFFGSDSIQANVTFSHGKLEIEQITQILGIPPGDICTFIAANVASIYPLLEKAALQL